MQLTELQKTLWENLGHESAATEKIRNMALEYYLEYRQHLRETNSFVESESKIQTLLLISYFISEKSEALYDVKGDKISNIAFSINQLAKKHSDYKDFFYHLKEMMRIVTLPLEAKQSEDQINGFMKYFSFVMTFYNKYLSTFDKITICHNINAKDLQSIGGEKEYKEKIKYFLWVVFITFRKVAFNNRMDTIGNTCLLACLFSYFISEIYKQQKITSVYAPDIALEYGTFPNQFGEIEEIWMGFFCLKDIKTYENVRNVFLQFIQNLSAKMPEIKQPFAPKAIFMNIKKLQQFYHKNMEISQIDETLFLANLMSNQQNIRFTAFGAKRKVAKYHSTNIIQCRRVLNYETEIKNNEPGQVSKKESGDNGSSNYLNVIKRIKASQTPVMLIQATPVNQFATAYNWLFTKSLSQDQNQNSLDLQQLLEMGNKNDSFQLGNNYVLQKRKLVQGLFKELLKQLNQENQESINVASILALEVFYYVMNITNRQITELVEALNVSWFAVWKGVDTLLNYDKTMPNNVKTHLLLLQTSIVSSLIWKDNQFIESLIQTEISEQSNDFFYRILHHIAYQINFIGKTVNLPEPFMDQAFIVCQYYLRQFKCMMTNMNLDVIIMCAIYGVCRAKNSNIKFKNIISAYKQVNSLDDKAFEALDSFTSEEGETYNLILYYNRVFLKNCKAILLKIKEQKLQSDDNFLTANYILSPVKQILPKGLMTRGNTLGTPKYSQMLFAYNESPLLSKKTRLNLTNQCSNKQNIELPLNNPKKLFNESQTLRERSTNISEMIQKKFGNGKNSTLVPKSYHLKQV